MVATPYLYSQENLAQREFALKKFPWQNVIIANLRNLQGCGRITKRTNSRLLFILMIKVKARD